MVSLVCIIGLSAPGVLFLRRKKMLKLSISCYLSKVQLGRVLAPQIPVISNDTFYSSFYFKCVWVNISFQSCLLLFFPVVENIDSTYFESSRHMLPHLPSNVPTLSHALFCRSRCSSHHNKCNTCPVIRPS